MGKTWEPKDMEIDWERLADFFKICGPVGLAEFRHAHEVVNR